jgi:hypothetical protein
MWSKEMMLIKSCLDSIFLGLSLVESEIVFDLGISMTESGGS